MGVVKSDHGNIKPATRSHGFPRDLIGVSRLDDVGHFLFQNLLDEMQLREGTVAGGARKQRRGDGINPRLRITGAARRLPWNDDHMLAVRPEFAEIGRLLLDIPPHPSTHRGVELGEIADFQRRRTGLM